jgi:protein tyrosine/serine phosphatase
MASSALLESPIQIRYKYRKLLPTQRIVIKDTLINQVALNITTSLHPLTPIVSEILPQRLYLGNIHSCNSQLLNNLNINNVICILYDQKFKEHRHKPRSYEINYITINAEDGKDSSLVRHIRPLADFIHNTINHNESVLVHCYAGVSRSATVVLAYLMIYHNFKLTEALNYVKSIRPHINLNPFFEDYLKKNIRPIF